jgi:hypothetical protein
MRHSIRLGAAIALLITLVACGGGSESSDTLSPLPTTATTIPDTTLAPMTTSVAPESTTTSSTSSTLTTVAPAEQLVLREDGLGDVLFGVDADQMILYVTQLLGKPDSDSGYIGPVSEFGSCPGTQVRGVRWGDLLLMFGDESEVAQGRVHFYSWTYGPVQGIAPEPMGPVTDGDITLGSTVAEILNVYPTAEIFNDDILGMGFEINRTLTGTLSNDSPNGVVVSMTGGVACAT